MTDDGATQFCRVDKPFVKPFHSTGEMLADVQGPVEQGRGAVLYRGDGGLVKLPRSPVADERRSRVGEREGSPPRGSCL
jgi:hypothetical protein